MGSANGVERAGGVDLYVGGVEHAVLHLLYARFWHKILFDLGYVSTPEPFQRLYNQGYTYQGKPVRRVHGKMGKSLKNAVSPDDVYDAYGAIDDTPFPIADPDALVQTQVVLPVTVNGKPRGEIIVDQQASRSEVTDAGLALEAVAKLVEGREIVNFVVR